MQRSSRNRRSSSPRTSRWVVAFFVAVVVGVGGAGAAVLVRHRSLTAQAATPDQAAKPSARATTAPASGGDGTKPAAKSSATASHRPSATPSPTGPARCQYLATSDGPGGQRRPGTPDPRPTLSGHPHVTLTTNQGAIGIDLAADAALCTVNSFLSLARGGFFAGTDCHRLTTDSLYVLQCGDPSGTGQGGPGYRFGDENLPTGSRPAYPRGTLAMANAGPATNGSQFFLVYKDSEIDPNYSVFGRVTSGLDVLDRIAAAGTDNANGPGDGRPRMEVTISRVG
ncbi:peptidylprolyl isomerase [Planosporangium sp. 12N6]|uniref:peptidylprolyl isomerase n=1 Tax=Planosporangium spinosum TaxID=3402278 RepID=UPI003CF3F5DB